MCVLWFVPVVEEGAMSRTARYLTADRSRAGFAPVDLDAFCPQPGHASGAGRAPCLRGCCRPARGGRPRSRRVPLDRGCDSRDAIVAPARTQAGPVTVYMPTPDEAGENDLSPASRASLRYRRRKEPEAIESRRTGRRTCAELIHAHCRNRALERIDVRGGSRHTPSSLWHAPANDILATQRIRAAAQNT